MMEIIRREDGTIELEGDLEEVKTKGDLLSVLIKMGATISKPNYSKAGAQQYATLDLENGYASVKIEDTERYMDKDASELETMYEGKYDDN